MKARPATRNNSLPLRRRRQPVPGEELRPFPIRRTSDYDRALRAVEPLVSRARLTRQERDFLEIMVTLIEKYEEDRYPMATAGLSGLDVLRHLLEANGLSGADLGRILGTRTQGYPILRGERELTRAHMLRLGEYFHVPPGVFLGARDIPVGKGSKQERM